MNGGEVLGAILLAAVLFFMGFAMGEHAGRDRAWDELKAAVIAAGGHVASGGHQQ